MNRPLFPILCLLLIFSGDSSAEDNSDREYSIKAVFLYNVTKFIRWPESSTSPHSPSGLTFCVAGDNPFDGILDQLAEKVSARGKKMSVKYPPVSMAMSSCHLLFVSSSEINRIARILDLVKNSPVLVVGDTPEFEGMGVGLNFYIQENKVRFKIDKEAVERPGLKISSELLGLAEMGGGLK